MTKTSLKDKLAAHTLVLGGWVMIGHPASAEIMARAGFDWVCIDLEHTATDIETVENLIRAIEIGGAAPLVRLTNNDPNLIKRVTDSGAAGIIVPMVETPLQAQAAVDALYYPPRGKRGVGLARAQKYGAGFDSYKTWLDTQVVCIVQIEHIDAVRNAQAILSVPGVDGYMLGPYDLSASMGLPGQVDHPDVLTAIDQVRKTAKAMGKPGGIHVVEPDPARLRSAIDKGFTFIAYGIDTRIIDMACRAGLSSTRGDSL
ncbi:MAG TPA: aldolase/citrate lyase family protein [Alphaproteobacteria bacterium]|nr:aldolase/citrate lyase family protein [Alphaproteobacteria bacterium]